MILSLIILMLMVINIYDGFRDGLVYEFIRIISYLIAWAIALGFTHSLGSLLNSFLGLDPILVNGLSFVIIFIVAVVILKAIGRIFNHVTDFPVIHQLNAIGGAVIGALVGYLIIFILLNVCLALPSAWMQKEYTNSPVALKIIDHTPGMTDHLINK